jgi:hypothetical protein
MKTKRLKKKTIKKIDGVLIRIITRKGENYENYCARDTIIHLTKPVPLELVEDECLRAFKKTFDLVCREVQT